MHNCLFTFHLLWVFFSPHFWKISNQHHHENEKRMKIIWFVHLTLQNWIILMAMRYDYTDWNLYRKHFANLMMGFFFPFRSRFRRFIYKWYIVIELVQIIVCVNYKLLLLFSIVLNWQFEQLRNKNKWQTKRDGWFRKKRQQWRSECAVANQMVVTST